MFFKSKFAVAGMSLVASLFAANIASATPNNEPPPQGAIFDLDGLPTTQTYKNYSVDFIAAVSATDITFAIRNDPNFTNLTNIVLTDVTNPGGNLIVNGTFLGQGTNINGWTFDNVYGARASGVARNGYWYDGAVQAYDAIDQVVATHIGDTYHLSFDISSIGTDHFARLSTNGQPDSRGNANDVLVYAAAGLPPAGVPEPASLAVLGAGLAGLALARRARKA